MCPPPRGILKAHVSSASVTATITDTNDVSPFAAAAARHQQQRHPKVSFSQVHVHEFDFIMGDNPAVSKGVPLTIVWAPHAHDIMDVEFFEFCREPQRRPRKQCVLSSKRRVKILLSKGYDIADIADMTMKMQSIRQERAESLKASGGSDSVMGFGKLNIGDFFGESMETLRMVDVLALPTATLGAMVGAGQAVGKVGQVFVKGTGKVVAGTGKVASDVVLGTGQFVATGATTVVKGTGDLMVGTVNVGRDVVLGTGQFVATGATTVVKGTGDLVVGTVVGTGRVGRDVVVGTGRVATDVVKGTGNLVVGTGKAVATGATRASSIVVGSGKFLVGGTGKALNGFKGMLTMSDNAKVAIRSGSRSPRREKSTSPIRRKTAADFDDLFSNSSSLLDLDASEEMVPPTPRQVMPKRVKSTDDIIPVGRALRKEKIRRAREASSIRHTKTVLTELDEVEGFISRLQGMDPERVQQIFKDESKRTVPGRPLLEV